MAFLNTVEGLPPKKDPLNHQEAVLPDPPRIHIDIQDDWYKAIIKSAIDGFCLVDNEGYILDVNDAFCRMLGHSRKEMLSMKAQDFQVGYINNPEEFVNISRLNQIRIDGYGSGETKHMRSDGKTIDVFVSATYLDVGPGIAVCFVNDVSKKKEVLRQLKESEERYRSLIELGDRIGEAIIMLQDIDGKEGIQTFVSDSWLNITGYSRDELINMSFVDLLYPIYRDHALEGHRKTMSGESMSGQFEVQIIRKDGSEASIEVNNCYTTYQGKGANVGYLRDITERKKIEQELEKHRENLEELVNERTIELTEANKKLRELYQRETELRRTVEEQTERTVNFVRTLVHEIKTPFTPMIGASKLLVDTLEEERLQRIAKNVYRGACNLNNRINDLLDLINGKSGLIELECHRMAPLELLSEVVEYVTPEAERNKQLLRLITSTSPPEIYADEERLRQVLLNLLNNAVRFTPEEGQITVSYQMDDSKLVISVADTGCGIDEKVQRHLFEHILRVESIKQGGLGLGLPLSKMLVELHGGKIWVESQKGSGSTFSFSIPTKARLPVLAAYSRLSDNHEGIDN